jgi:hypothetical protein
MVVVVAGGMLGFWFAGTVVFIGQATTLVWTWA